MRSSILTSLLTLGPYHLMIWGTLLGMELYQSLVMTKLCYRHLPMPQFMELQKNVFPVYFSAQAALVTLTAATYPPAGILSLVKSRAITSVHLPLAINLATAGLNAMVYGPRTSNLMMERHKALVKQETQNRSGTSKTENDQEETLKRIKKDFSRNHGMAIHLNAISMVATVWYGVGLASKIRFVL